MLQTKMMSMWRLTGLSYKQAAISLRQLTSSPAWRSTQDDSSTANSFRLEKYIPAPSPPVLRQSFFVREIILTRRPLTFFFNLIAIKLGFQPPEKRAEIIERTGNHPCWLTLDPSHHCWPPPVPYHPSWPPLDPYHPCWPPPVPYHPWGPLLLYG